MTVYVDPCRTNGWRLRGFPMKNAHLFSDRDDLAELHAVAKRIGMRPEWFQPSPPASIPHYDLTPRRREAAIEAGAVPVTRRHAVEIWRRIKARKQCERANS